MYTRRYDEYMERHEDDDFINVYQEEIEGCQSFTVSDGTGLEELATRNVELMPEEPGPSKKRLRKSQRIIEREQRATKKQQRRERLDARVAEADSDADDF